MKLATATPGVTYDLAHLVYPKGVILIPPFDTETFARTIIGLLEDDARREQLGREAKAFARTLAWELQADRALLSLGIMR